MKKIKKKRVVIIATAFTALVLLYFAAVNTSLAVRSYHLSSSKVREQVRIALVTDLHSCDYGDGQSELAEAVKKAAPDLVLLGGDIVDDVLPDTKAKEFLASIGRQYPCFYVSGNHEYWSNKMDEIKSFIKDYGITVLEGNGESIEINGQKLNIFGIDDPEVGEEEFYTQLLNSVNWTGKDSYNVLLTHRPERIMEYANYNFDLTVAGHAHGGQFRLPGVINGLFAPDQGWFPKYAGGNYQYNNMDFVVSRGLSRESSRLPRIFNRPELVIIDINPE